MMIVADATNRYQVWVSRWNIAPQLSQESFELKQICQWLKCTPRWEEHSINRVFHCSTPGSQDIVADATNRDQVWVSRWNIAPQLSQESFELKQICQWLKCAPRWEEHSINRVFHCSTPGSQDIVADATNRKPSMGKPLEHCTSIISRTIWVRTNKSMAKMCTSMRGIIY